MIDQRECKYLLIIFTFGSSSNQSNNFQGILNVLMEVEEAIAAQAPNNVGKGKEIATLMLTVLAI